MPPRSTLSFLPPRRWGLRFSSLRVASTSRLCGVRQRRGASLLVCASSGKQMLADAHTRFCSGSSSSSSGTDGLFASAADVAVTSPQPPKAASSASDDASASPASSQCPHSSASAGQPPPRAPQEMATVLTSLHHVQRLLRRLPVGDASALLHLNELPSNVQEKLPVVVQQHRGRQSRRPGSEPRTADDDNDGDYSRLFTMRPPTLTVSDTALFALFRTAQKERRAQRCRHHHRQQQQQQQQEQEPTSLSTPSDALSYLRDLEEACLLLPDTRNSRVSLGIATGVHEHALSPQPNSAMDAVYVSLASSCTDYRVDYASVPLYYILGIPTRSMVERDDAQQGKVDLSRWLVVDLATGQMLLRRRHDPRTAPSSEATDATATATHHGAPSVTADLDAEVFLAQTYSFEPRRAYAAALQASTTSPGASPLYTLFYLQLARGHATQAAGVSPETAGTTYPASFVSYTTEVCTTRELAVRAAAATSTSGAGDGDADRGGTADSMPLFMSLGGKRMRFGGAAQQPSASSSPVSLSDVTESHLWTTQVVNRQHSTPLLQSRFSKAESPASSTDNYAAADAGRQREASAQNSLRTAVAQSFHDWQAMVAATGAADAGSASAEMLAAAHTPSDMAGKAAAVPHTRTPTAVTDVAEEAGHRCADAATAADHGPPSLLERQLDAEAPPGPHERQRGLRLRRVSIAVARPLLPQCPAAPQAPSLRVKSSLNASAHPLSLWRDMRGRRVSEAPLAAALWEALYVGPTPLPSADFSAGCLSVDHGVDVLPLGIDRLARARERVLVPFLVHQPRCVLPDCAAPSTTPPTPPHTMPMGEGDGRQPSQQHVTVRSAPEATVCPLLWRLAEVEQVCGWHREAAVFERAFGTFAGLMVREMYVTVGQRGPALPVTASGLRAHLEKPVSPPQSPLVLFADVVYVLRVLHPALWAFAGHTCTQQASDLLVYRPLLRAGRSPTATRATEGEGEENSAEMALAVALHHRRLRVWLRRLQAVAPAQLRAWLTTAHSCSTSKMKAAAATVAEASTVPASCLLFFAGAVHKSSSEACIDEAGRTAATTVSAAELSGEELSRAMDRLLALTPSCIRVVPLMDFVVWGATAADFSPASMRCHAANAARCRAAMDDTTDGVALVRYCMRFPRQMCCEGGDGRTVAVLRSRG